MKTRKAYRELLNKQDLEFRPIREANGLRTMHHNGRYQQRKRAYGDYLYFQDREKFEVEYKEWAVSHE